MGDLGSIPGLGRSPGGGKGYPLQYSGPENFMDHTVHGVAKSQTRRNCSVNDSSFPHCLCSFFPPKKTPGNCFMSQKEKAYQQEDTGIHSFLKGDHLAQHCHLDLSALMLIFSVCSVWLPLAMVAVEHLKCA